MPPSQRFAESREERNYGKHQNSTNYRKQERKKESERLQPPRSVIARQHEGDYLYTAKGFVMSRQGDVWRTPLECRMEGPIRVHAPKWSVPLEGLYRMESLVEGPENSSGPKLTGKQNLPEGKSPSSEMSPRF